MGIDPMELAQVAASAGTGGNTPAGMAPMEPKEAQILKQACEDVARLKLAGKFAFTAPRNRKLAETRAGFRSYIAEVIGARS
jgi:hypothetical protein